MISCGSKDKNQLKSDAQLERRFEQLTSEVHHFGEEMKFRLDTLAKFDWDTIIVLKPYCNIDKVEHETNVDLNAVKKTRIVHDEVSNVLAFISKGKLVNYVDLPRNKSDFSHLKDDEIIISREYATFTINEINGDSKNGYPGFIIQLIPQMTQDLFNNMEIFKVKVNRTPTIWFDKNKDFEILSSKRGITESSSAPDTNDCSGWNIKKENINMIIQHSDSLSGPDWHYLFSVYPCIVVGELKQDNNIYKFEINGGAWMYIYCPDTTILLGDFRKGDEKYFISGVWDGK